ncbi:MAG: DUF1735 domain-containing protein [Bacteroidales bacterium]|nr:DUF1735 domain-containing protein [Bacteroidales bacterium]
MKKSLVFVAVITALLSFNSCTKYDDYYSDFPYTTSYFAKTQMDRSVIIDEYDFIQVGAVLGGKLENDREEWVQYELVDSLVTLAGYEVLPSSLYETENDELNGMTNVITIPKGSFLGMMKIKLNADFFSDPKAITPTYALAFKIVDASSDSIGNDEVLVTFKYLSNAVGVYTHRGRAVSAVDTLTYLNNDTELITSEPVGTNSAQSNKLDIGALGLILNLTIDSENKVSFSSGEGSDITITAVNPGFFDRENDHNIYLNYTFDDAGKTYQAQDTLVFVKRVIDNVMQWDTRYF